ncbi:MAG: Methylated-DNA--protein-cysteine methyltransferase, constitutive [Chlamydiales bacterium]|nr:Methylated-DNA--protein-cysteine methyltransferase, constitutive [Chlamydiales bacterium]
MLKLKIVAWTDKGVVQRVQLSSSPSFALHIEGPALPQLNRFIEAYLEKEEAPLPPLCTEQLTPFTQRVLGAAATLSFGKSCTYSELAAQIGLPKGPRAVGNALGRNPVPLLLPCHRILAKNGLGGFTGGLEIKSQLLNHECDHSQ